VSGKKVPPLIEILIGILLKIQLKGVLFPETLFRIPIVGLLTAITENNTDS